MSANLIPQMNNDAPRKNVVRNLKRSLYEIFVQPFEAWGWFKLQAALERADRRFSYNAANRKLLPHEYPMDWDEVCARQIEIEGIHARPRRFDRRLLLSVADR